MVSDAIAKGNVQALNYFRGAEIHRGPEGLCDFPPNQKGSYFMPVEALGTAGLSVGGIAELARDAIKGAYRCYAPPATMR